MDLYSRTVALLKVILPLAALAILATLFMLSRSDDPATTIPFAEKDMATRMRDQQVTSPFFSGVTPKGDEIIVSASVARPGGHDVPAEAFDINARITLANGGRITLESETGSINATTDRVVFSGNVRVDTTTGYHIRTDRLEAAISGVTGETPGPVEGTGPIGEFTAGQMQYAAKNGDGSVHMLFKSGVKLIYDPKKAE